MNYKKENTNEETIDIRELILKYLVYWRWFLLSGVVCLLLALCYIRMTMPVYNITSVIMIKDEKKGGNFDDAINLFDNLGILGGNSSTENEVEVLKSKSLIRDVIIDLNLNVSYIGNRVFKKIDLYEISPVVADISSLNAGELSYPLKIEVDGIGTSSISVEMTEDDEVLVSNDYPSFPIFLQTPYGSILLQKQNVQPQTKDIFDKDKEEITNITIYITNPVSLARSYLQNLTVAPTSKNSSVVDLSFKNTSVQRGTNFLNRLIEKYNNTAMDDKNKIAKSTAAFIDERLVIIGKELGTTEREIESYKKQEGLTDIMANSQLSLKENSEYEQKRVENETQLNLIRFLREYVNEQKENVVIPSNIGLTDAGLLAQIGKYNDLLLERNRLLHTTSEDNPVVINNNNVIASLFDNIKALLNNVEQSLMITQKDLDRQAGKFRTQIANIPTQERVFVEIDRQRQIQSALFIMLLQKREENALAMAVTSNKAKIIDETLPDESPISPKKKLILLAAFILAAAIPIGIIFIRDFLNVKFSSKQDIEKEKLTQVPILAEIPIKDSYKDDPKKSEAIFSEAFRLLRTNINFMLNNHKKVILVTSSIPGEGKTFISVNIAKSFALLNKKVLLIGMDIRNPQLSQFFSATKKHGVTNLLADSEVSATDMIQTDQTCPNLDFILAGPVPPNPSELLSREVLDYFINQLCSDYDYIIIDTAPVGIVPDTLILQRVADMTLYVCRADYTNKKSFELLNNLQEENKLPNISLVVNGVKKSNSHYGYDYGNYQKKKKSNKK